ncbi:hypothetical protein [Sphingobium sp. CECT 9361]|nr:hypothetical protein [Sphingobium sp. CECT 9361]CAH0355477.1 hypothetical protein SPH9361_03556 [Sphingobium sp. CECT 9361]
MGVLGEPIADRVRLSVKVDLETVLKVLFQAVISLSRVIGQTA